MTCNFPKLGSACDWLKQIFLAARTIRSTAQIVIGLEISSTKNTAITSLKNNYAVTEFLSLLALALTCKSVDHQNCPPWNLEMRGSELIFIVIINELSWIPVCSCKEIESYSNLGWALRLLYQRVWMRFKATILLITDLLREKPC